MTDVQVVHPTRFVDALQHFNLDWKVEPRALYTFDNAGQQLLVEDAKTIVRVDIGLPLSIVGNRYVPLQNDVAADVIDGVLAKTGGAYVKGGMFGDGRKVYVQAQLPEQIIVKGNDASAKLLTFVTSHDSTSQMYMGFTAIRIICQNTFMMAMRDIKNQVVIRHTRSADSKLKMTQEILEAQIAYFGHLEIKANWLADQRFSDLQFDAAMRKVLDVEGETEIATRTANIMDTLRTNFVSGQGIDASNRGTAWAAANAFTEYSNHQKGTRGVEGEEAQADRRFENVLFGMGATFNDRAFKAIDEVLAA